MTAANGITVCRMLCSLALVLFPPASVPFGILYLFCGLSDMADGWIARKTDTVSKAGERLDGIADLLFFAVAAGKLLPLLRLPLWIWGWTALIAVFRIVSILRRKEPLPHSRLNKLTGLLLFLFPMTLPLIPASCSAALICTAASAATLSEAFM